MTAVSVTNSSGDMVELLKALTNLASSTSSGVLSMIFYNVLEVLVSPIKEVILNQVSRLLDG